MPREDDAAVEEMRPTMDRSRKAAAAVVEEMRTGASVERIAAAEERTEEPRDSSRKGVADAPAEEAEAAADAADADASRRPPNRSPHSRRARPPSTRSLRRCRLSNRAAESGSLPIVN
jgi:hypothetical protein